MKETRIIMGMPVTVEVVHSSATYAVLEEIFAYFVSIDERFSTYKSNSEIAGINRGEILQTEYSSLMQEVFALAEETKKETYGYFNIKKPDGSLDPSGIVKGWAIQHAAIMLRDRGYTDFYIDAGGDIQSHGVNAKGELWSVGIRNPFDSTKVVKVIYPHGLGVATSGTYIRGQHIYNPHEPMEALREVVSLSVMGPDILHADRFATGAFAMGTEGINFIEQLPGFEGYAIDGRGIATMTSGLKNYTKTV